MRGLRLAVALLAALGLAGVLAGGASAQQPVPTAPRVIDGPSSAIGNPSGLGISIARDGTGGLVYLKQVGGAQHVFVSALTGGTFQPPVQVDGGLGASSRPVIAAGNGGLLLVAFISGGELYVVDRASSSSPLGAPGGLAAGASNPAIAISNFGKAYLAYSAAEGGGNDVRAVYYYNGTWALAPTPVNVSPTDGAGTGSGRPAVAAAGDGVGIVAWGEGGHVFTRRVWGPGVSVVTEQADAALPGCSEVSADQPVIGAEGDSSYVPVAFHEVLNCGDTQQSRVLMNRLQGSVFTGLMQPDGLAGSSSDGAGDPQLTMGEYGNGWVTSSRTSSNNLVATALGNSGVGVGFTQVNSLPEASAPDGIPATAGLFSTLIAWQQNPGSSGQPEIRMRYAPQNGSLGPELVVSSSAQGPTAAGSGLTAAGDVAGDSAVAWVQGPPGAYQIMAAQLYQPPGGFGPVKGKQYVALPQPQLSWSPANEPWGPVTYTVTLDGRQIAQTQATSLAVPIVLSDGPHSWSVTATNPAGQTTQGRAATVFVDTVAPTAQLRLFGTRQVHKRLHVFVPYTDPPPPGEPAANASGVASVLVSWGDATVSHPKLGRHRSFHTYSRPGTYTITAAVTDRAGNVGRAVLVVKIKPKPKPKKKPRPRPRHRRRA